MKYIKNKKNLDAFNTFNHIEKVTIAYRDAVHRTENSIDDNLRQVQILLQQRKEGKFHISGSEPISCRTK